MPIVNIVTQLGCVSQDSDVLVSRRGKQSRWNPMQKVWGSIRKVWFTQSMPRHASIREKKGGQTSSSAKSPRYDTWGPVPWRDWKTTVMRPKQGSEPCQKQIQAQRKIQSYILLTRGRMGTPGCGAGMHMVSKRDLNSAELETMRTSRSPTTVMTANGEVQTREEATANVKELDLFVTVMFLEETLTVLSLGKLCEDHGFTHHWTRGQKPHLTKKGKRIDCNLSNYVPLVVLGLLQRPHLLPHHLHHRSQHRLTENQYRRTGGVENPVPERNGSTSEELRWNPLHKPTETENKIKNEGREEVQSDLLHDLWWALCLHALSEGPNLRCPLEDKITRAFCRRCALVTWQQQITKFSAKKVNRVTIIDMPWWYKIWQRSGYNRTHVKQKLPRRPRRA